MQIIYEELRLEHLCMSVFESFNRYQEVKRCRRKEKGSWVLKDVVFTEQWDKDDKTKRIEDLKRTVETGGKVYGAFQDQKLVGFCSVESALFGSQNQYIQLSNLHITYGYRGQGIGKTLFGLALEAARVLGAKRLYISAHSSEETQAFYKKLGCCDAAQINQRLAKAEPFDCQLEYDLPHIQ